MITINSGNDTMTVNDVTYKVSGIDIKGSVFPAGAGNAVIKLASQGSQAFPTINHITDALVADASLTLVVSGGNSKIYTVANIDVDSSGKILQFNLNR